MADSLLITSQHFLSDEIIASKIAASDFAITVSPAFEIDGRMMRVVLDGHHSLAAAIEAGIEYDMTEADAQACDSVSLIKSQGIEAFLESCHMGEGDYIGAITRQYVF